MACVQDFSLRLRAKGNDESLLQKIDWEKLTNAVLDVNNPKGLVKNLRTAFEKLPFNDDFDLKANLKTNVKFVFGPPGTGKTYYLAHEIISKQIRERKECRILVLTPTNQAADVITKELLKDKVNVVEGLEIDENNKEKAFKMVEKNLTENLIVKPNALGSSIGVKA